MSISGIRMSINRKSKTNNSDVSSALELFDSIPLYKMNKVTLMRRTDTKYVLPFRLLPAMLLKLSGSYKVMEIFQEKVFPYRTTYFDTEDFLFFNQHMTGKRERHKIRYRKYEASGVSYLEIKKKTNRNTTEKVRIVNTLSNDGFDDRGACFITSNTVYNPDLLSPKLINTFTRTTLVNLYSNERITFDYHIEFSTMDGEKIGFPHIAVAELKKEGCAKQSDFINVARSFNIRPVGFSKYCIGSYYIRTMPRTNLLKPKIHLINKISNDNYPNVAI